MSVKQLVIYGIMVFLAAFMSEAGNQYWYIPMAIALLIPLWSLGVAVFKRLKWGE